MQIECRECGGEFDPDTQPAHLKKRGFRNVCSQCKAVGEHGERVPRHIGIQGGEGVKKSANIAILKGDDPNAAFALSAQRFGGYNARLPLAGYSNTNSSGEFAGAWEVKKNETTSGK